MFSSSVIPLAGTPLAFIDGVGGMEMLLIFVVALMLFGGEKLPEFARNIGKMMREFKKAASGVEEEFKRAMDEDERKRNTTAIETSATTPALTSPIPARTPANRASFSVRLPCIFQLPATSLRRMGNS